MSDMVKDVIEMILFAVITGCGVMIVKKVFGLVNSKIDEIQATTKLSNYAQLNKYIDAAQAAISTAVTSVSQTYVDSLKADGKFDEAAQTTAKEKAVTIAKNLITDDSKNAISVLFGDFELFLGNTIEAVVKKNK